ncbi:50S ribosomal protein L10 [candidate division KSB1 bacterium]|nr:50S ribosomal protein L10 [candidate division KSB1 bacterium]
MPNPEKITRVEKLNKDLEGATGVYLTDFTGLSVEQITELRREFRKVDVNYIVVKNTLARLSAEKTGFEKLLPYLKGPTGLAISKEDPIAPVRVIYEFKKNREKPAIKGAIIEGQFYDEHNAEEMRKIPSRDELIGQVASVFAAPLSGFVGGLRSLLSGLVYTVNAIKEQKEE